MSQESTYSGIIEEKIEEWRGKIDILKGQVEKAPVDKREQLQSRINQLQSAIDTATLQLHDLDKKETKENTVAIKNDILKIFQSIDRDLTISDAKTPYML